MPIRIKFCYMISLINLRVTLAHQLQQCYVRYHCKDTLCKGGCTPYKTSASVFENVHGTIWDYYWILKKTITVDTFIIWRFSATVAAAAAVCWCSSMLTGNKQRVERWYMPARDDSPSIPSPTDAEMPAGQAARSPHRRRRHTSPGRAMDASPAAPCFWKSLPALSASALYGLQRVAWRATEQPSEWNWLSMRRRRNGERSRSFFKVL